VSAARLGAQQAYDEKQQELRLNAIREAIPLLTLQTQMQQAAAARKLAGSGSAPASGTSIGAVGSPDEFAQKFTPIAQTIADQTGLPVDYVLAQAAHETGFGKSPAAANNNFFGITDPKTGKLASYATPQEGAAAYVQLMQSDRYANVPRAGTPAQIGDRMALAGYNPNVPAKDKTDSYGARIGGVASMLARPKPGAPGAPPVASGGPGAPTAAPSATAPPPVVTDQPPSAGFAGPGAPSTARVAAVSPAVPGDVSAIIRGMTGAGADPTTLQPPGPAAPPPVRVAGPGAPTATAPPAPEELPLADAMAKAKATGQPVLIQGGNGAAIKPDGTINMPTAAPAATQQPPQYPDVVSGGVTVRHPGSFADFSARERLPIPASENFNPDLTPEQKAAFAAKAAGLDRQQQLLATLPFAEQPKAADALVAARAALTAEQQNAAQAKAQAAAAAKTVFDVEQNKAVQTRYDAAVTNYNAAVSAQGAASIKSDELEHTAKLKAQENEQTSRLASRAKVLDKLDVDAAAAHENLDQLQMVRELSDAAGGPGVLAGYPELRSWLVKTGVAGPDDVQKWSAQQALDSAANRLTLALRSGSGFSRMTNMDLQFLQHTSPQSFNPQEWRDAQIAYLMTAYERQQKFTGLVHRGVADGMSLSDAQDAADKELGPTIKKLPTKFDDGSPMTSVDQARWNWDNLLPGSFYKDPAGNLRIFKPKTGSVRP
jgi:hypothetical protein